MSTFIAFCIGCLLIGVAFKAGQAWERGKPPTPIGLATYIPPQLPKAPSIHDQIDMLMEHIEASEGTL